MNKLSTLGLLALALWGCQRPEANPTTQLPAHAKGQVMRYDVTYDAENQHPRLRCIVQLAYPLKMPGLGNQPYAQVKVFNLPDTATYRVGTKLVFTYSKLPQSEQTPWLTNYERYAAGPFSPGYMPNPELVVANVQAL